LRISQPAVSQALKDLESQLGFSIFSRIGGRTRLTEEAMLLLPRVERVLSQISSLKGHALELRDMRTGQLSIATIASLCTIIPTAMARFRSERQQIRFKLAVHTAEDVATQVKNELADIGFAFTPIEEINVACEPLLRTSLVCIVPKGHAFSEKRVVEIKDLKSETVIMQGQENRPGMAFRETIGVIDDEFAALTTNHSIAAINMVRHGLGVGLVHPLVLSFAPSDEVISIPFVPDVSLTLAILYSRHRPVSRITNRFVTILKEFLRSQSESFSARGIPFEILL
jgi:DNA-binding transcriptional LysR family regulator